MERILKFLFGKITYYSADFSRHEIRRFWQPKPKWYKVELKRSLSK